MSDTLKILAQSNPATSTLTDAYTVPASTSAVISTGTVANRSSIADIIRISWAPAGVADDLAQYSYYDAPIPGNSTLSFTFGVTLAATDVARVYSTNGTSSFNFFGSEVT